MSFNKQVKFGQEDKKLEHLTAKSNEKIKAAVSIRDSARARREQHLFFLEGARLCGDAAENGVHIQRAFFTQSALKKYAAQTEKIISASKECYTVSDELAQKLSDTQNSQGVFCVCSEPRKSVGADKIKPDGKYILLENVQDPSNLGAVSRTAEALGIDGLIVCGGCDIYNPKALRASMGSALRLNIISCDSAVEFIKKLNSAGVLTLASTPSTDSTPITEISMDGGVCCVVGNEGNGITAETMAICAHRVTIPMGGRAESLNASTAAAILIWEMVRK